MKWAALRADSEKRMPLLATMPEGGREGGRIRFV